MPQSRTRRATILSAAKGHSTRLRWRSFLLRVGCRRSKSLGAITWIEARAPEFAHVDPASSVALLPLAAVEQHGPHLPVGTDVAIMDGMLNRVRSLVPQDLDVWLLPIQKVGLSSAHMGMPGTLTLNPTTALNVWTEIGLSVARAGFRKIIIVQSHAGGMDFVAALARELRVQAEMLAVTCAWESFGTPATANTMEDGTAHGGDIETSLMRALCPEQVEMALAQDFLSAAGLDPIPLQGTIGRGWTITDLHPDGAVGDASAATAERGTAIADFRAAAFVAMLEEIREMPLPTAFLQKVG